MLTFGEFIAKDAPLRRAFSPPRTPSVHVRRASWAGERARVMLKRAAASATVLGSDRHEAERWTELARCLLFLLKALSEIRAELEAFSAQALALTHSGKGLTS